MDDDPDPIGSQLSPDRYRLLETMHRLAASGLAKPMRDIGSFLALSLDIMVQMVRPPFAWREFFEQTWFVARVAIVPALLLALPFNAFVMFLFNILLVELGAADVSGAIAALASVSQIGPLVTVLVVAGAGASAMCADLGARTIREELDAMRVMGLDPVRMLLAPRVAALTVNAFLLLSIAIIVGIASDYAFAVYFQHVTPGAFAASIPLVAGLRNALMAVGKSVLFGAAAGFIACYKGTSVGGGPQGVGNAVNETVVFTFIALFVIHTLMNGIEGELMLS